MFQFDSVGKEGFTLKQRHSNLPLFNYIVFDIKLKQINSTFSLFKIVVYHLKGLADNCHQNGVGNCDE